MATNKKGYLKRYYRRERKKIIEKLGGKCSKCREKEYNVLEIHHIVPLNGNRPNGQLARLTEWKRNMHNLDVLCGRCHKAHHKNEKNHPLNKYGG